jgi:twinkle protein
MGSSNWYNKADNCLTVYRDSMNEVQVYIQKIKYKIRGEVGVCHFHYDRPTGIFRPGGEASASTLPPQTPKGAANDG